MPPPGQVVDPAALRDCLRDALVEVTHRVGPYDANHDGRVVVVCFGDSNTLGGLVGPGAAYPLQLERLLASPLWTVENAGFGGRAAFVPEARESLTAVLRERRPDFVILALGSVDLDYPDYRRSAADTRDALAALVRLSRATAPQTTVIVATVPQIRRHGRPNPEVDRLNALLLAGGEPFEHVVDFHTIVDDGQYLDWIHLNADAMRARAEAVLRHLSGSGAVPPAARP